MNGPDPGDLGGDDEGEAVLDVTWAGALAPSNGVALVVSASTNTTDGIYLSELYAIENNIGSVMAASFSSCEADATSADAQAISSLAQQAAAQGITFLVSTGDNGALECASSNSGDTTVSINVLASNPYTVAVGGTEFNENGTTARIGIPQTRPAQGNRQSPTFPRTPGTKPKVPGAAAQASISPNLPGKRAYPASPARMLVSYPTYL